MSAAVATSTPRERPILFKGHLVRAILAGTKTVTRRLVAPQPIFGPAPLGPAWEWPYRVDGGGGSSVVTADPRKSTLMLEHGPFKVGLRMWVKETHGIVFTCPELPCACEEGANLHRKVVFCATEPKGLDDYCASFDDDGPAKWKPSIFMRRADSRIDLEITGVAIERLQDITEDDARAEGVEPFFLRFPNVGREQTLTTGERVAGAEHRASFATTWDEINGGKRATWASNPWVWVVRFRRIRP